MLRRRRRGRDNAVITLHVVKFLVALWQRKKEMKILHRERIDRFLIKHADSVRPLQRWVDKIEEAVWRNHADLKQDFPSADYVGNGRYVFNIKGNSYRLVVVVTFVAGLLSIQFIGTHEEYDRIDCSTI